MLFINVYLSLTNAVSYLRFIFVIIAAEDEDMGPGAKRMRPGVSESIIAELTECNAALSQQRKKRQVLFIQFSLITSNYLFVDNIFISSF